MTYQLETDVVIDHLRGMKPLNPDLFQGDVYISVITYGELLAGAYKSKQPKRNMKLINSFLTEFRIQILPINEKVVEKWSQLKSVLELKGSRLDDIDLLIAASAMVNDLRLVSNNKKHFQRISDLKLI